MSEKQLMTGHDPVVSQLMSQMNRIEGKVDSMQTALVSMARTEERVVRLMEADQKKTEWVLGLQNRVSELEKSEIGSKAISTRIERAAWIFVTVLLTALAGWIATQGGI